MPWAFRYPRGGSNACLRLRRPPLYPLSYGGEQVNCTYASVTTDVRTRQGTLARPAPRGAAQPIDGGIDRRGDHDSDRVRVLGRHHPLPHGPGRGEPPHRAEPDRELHNVHARVTVQRHRARDAGDPVRDLYVHRPRAAPARAAVRTAARAVRTPALRDRHGVLLLRAAAA